MVASQNGPNRKWPQSKTAPLSVKSAPKDSKNRLKWPHRKISLYSLGVKVNTYILSMAINDG